MGVIEHAITILGLIDPPFVQVLTFEDKRLGTGYAVMLKGAKSSIDSWCHDPDKTDPHYFYHSTEADAQECFDKNHPGVRDAIEWFEAAGPSSIEDDLDDRIGDAVQNATYEAMAGEDL
jgi:hypothetical protein